MPDGLVGPNGQPMVVPKLSFLGFMKRPDGQQAAMFHDSVENTTFFYESGKQVRGVDIVSANINEAEIRFPDGTSRKLEIGGTVELAPEPAKAPPPKPAGKPAVGKPAPAAAKPAAAAKPGAAAKPARPEKPGARPQRGKPNPQRKAFQ
ncbi:MAG: hypothetical protein BWX70_02865 [Verrucomicrobia bacterium ADurb.Bin070]|nr:MAG: hypothetical protein BWX70_02865 [Verrucomicrobia bacterium ADurb.Bin070]